MNNDEMAEWIRMMRDTTKPEYDSIMLRFAYIVPLLDERDKLLAIATAAKALVAAIISPPDGCDVDWAGGLWWTREAEQRAQELVRVVNGPS